MRRQLIVTVAAVVSMVLLAMLVPTAVLVRSYALEDRLSRAALEVQATETVVSGAGEDKGDVTVYVDEINAADDGIQTTVLYADGTGVGPHPGEDARVAEARRTGQARVDDVEGGAQILVPVSSAAARASRRDTPVIRVTSASPGWTPGSAARGCCWPRWGSCSSVARWCWPTGWAGRSCGRWRTWPTGPARWARPTGAPYPRRCRVRRRYVTSPRRSTGSSAASRCCWSASGRRSSDLSHRLRTPGHRAASARRGRRRPGGA